MNACEEELQLKGCAFAHYTPSLIWSSFVSWNVEGIWTRVLIISDCTYFFSLSS